MKTASFLLLAAGLFAVAPAHARLIQTDPEPVATVTVTAAEAHSASIGGLVTTPVETPEQLELETFKAGRLLQPPPAPAKPPLPAQVADEPDPDLDAIALAEMAGAPVPESAAHAAAPLAVPALAGELSVAITRTSAPVWTLEEGMTLRENMRTWSRESGWMLMWSAVKGDRIIDYPVAARAVFAGDLVGAAGVVAKVISAYADADYPLEVEFFRANKVIEVRLHAVRIGGTGAGTPTHQEVTTAPAIAIKPPPAAPAK